MGQGIRLALECTKTKLRRLRDTPIAPSNQDAVGRRGLENEPAHPDQVGPEVHQGPVRVAVASVGPQPAHQLVRLRRLSPAGPELGLQRYGTDRKSVV